jgi:hypothetical protein
MESGLGASFNLQTAAHSKSLHPSIPLRQEAARDRPQPSPQRGEGENGLAFQGSVYAAYYCLEGSHHDVFVDTYAEEAGAVG